MLPEQTFDARIASLRYSTWLEVYMTIDGSVSEYQRPMSVKECAGCGHYGVALSSLLCATVLSRLTVQVCSQRHGNRGTAGGASAAAPVCGKRKAGRRLDSGAIHGRDSLAWAETVWPRIELFAELMQPIWLIQNDYERHCQALLSALSEMQSRWSSTAFARFYVDVKQHSSSFQNQEPRMGDREAGRSHSVWESASQTHDLWIARQPARRLTSTKMIIRNTLNVAEMGSALATFGIVYSDEGLVVTHDQLVQAYGAVTFYEL
ncbi:hypothetical protein SISNIDRAFT_466731 [Sistotremastrum niveocremeum HHB9708]|uniref:Uncharacterized protein n=1 Tax=Sistotremastrum niveocremeum HHB9708 TaxID=1314777 RepID=A0A164TF37_9AGAM|nr:hypothetical protein SISNIDRAFT_466731 [Sistotremastrum niveocremeum HHB9708]